MSVLLNCKADDVKLFNSVVSRTLYQSYSSQSSHFQDPTQSTGRINSRGNCSDWGKGIERRDRGWRTRSDIASLSMENGLKLNNSLFPKCNKVGKIN